MPSRRLMLSAGAPIGGGGSMTPDEAYSISAYISEESKIICGTTVVDAKNMPNIAMTNANGFHDGRDNDLLAYVVPQQK